jgi:hypothetical protein
MCSLSALKTPNNNVCRGWSPTDADSGQGHGLTEEDTTPRVFSVEPQETVDDYTPPGLGHSDNAIHNFYEQNCPYQQADLSNEFWPASKMFRLVEEFSEYEHLLWRRNTVFVWLILVQWPSV